jgi:four helix bundle protein
MNQLQDRLIQFTVDVTNELDGLYSQPGIKNLAFQLDKSVSSIGANYSEAQSACSKKDFHNKVKIALKEARETEYWLSILSKKMPQKNFSKLELESEELIKILTTIAKKTTPNTYAS